MELVSQVGFPIAVASYLLVRMEKKLDQFTKAVLELKVAIDLFSAKVK